MGNAIPKVKKRWCSRTLSEDLRKNRNPYDDLENGQEWREEMKERGGALG